MKTLYFECNMGAAGDMLSAALLELHPDPREMLERLNALGIPGVTFTAEPMEKCGIGGTHMKVLVDGVEEESLDVSDAGRELHSHSHGQEEHHHHHHEHAHDHSHGHAHVHRNLSAIREIVTKLELPRKVRDNVLAVYGLIAEAESHAHGRPVEEVHFHEVGAMDAVADITAFCLLLEELAPDRILASPVNVGFGEVRCAHGILPVPAPATAWILRDVPIHAGRIRGEMCTPTGAALLKHFVGDYCTLPQMRVRKIGIGCGKKDFEQANIVRALFGETPDSKDTVLELTCNLDDMTPEAVGFAMEEILAGGAVDVYVTPVTMKKSRPGFLLTCMCREPLRQKMLELLFRHTTTLGVREYTCNRYTLDREIQTLHTPIGEIRHKISSGWGAVRKKFEYEDLVRAARAEGISLAEAAECADMYRKKCNP